MRIIVEKSKAGGTDEAPASKSFTHRATILASLAEGRSKISNILVSDDTLLTIDACRKLGARISLAGNEAIIDGFAGKPAARPGETIYLGNSGTSMRLLASIAALSPEPVVLDGDERMRKRPIGDLLDALNLAGFFAQSINNNGCPPIKVWSKATGIADKITVRASTSSQFVSSLLLVAPLAGKKTTISIEGEAKSRPYIEITLEMMRLFGATARNGGFRRFDVEPVGHYTCRDYTVEADYSSASYFFAAAAVTGGKVAVAGLNPDSAQGDAKFILMIGKMGARIRKESDGKITVTGPAKLVGAGEIDCSDCPDSVPTICAVAACAHGTTKIVNVGHLRAKESDRITDLVAELKRFGCDASEGPDWIMVNGNGTEALHGATIDPHNDHRLAMGFAVLGMAVGKTTILGAECVSKSFPDFFERLERIGARLERNDDSAERENIVLIGFMGTGKSEVAREISTRTGRKLIDLDSEIEKTAGMKIPKIFESEGDAGFRKREAEECAKASKETGCVISCGGGAVLDGRNVTALKENGKLYWLKASPEIIWERVSEIASKRPLLAGGGMERVRTLLSMRKNTYAKAADASVDTAKKSVAEIAGDVLSLHSANKTVKCTE
ncbi:MAG: 3-phosphoshikimate 1-carboxyvinyltransferase [Candidatus Micrarchaeia archaeon]